MCNNNKMILIRFCSSWALRSAQTNLADLVESCVVDLLSPLPAAAALYWDVMWCAGFWLSWQLSVLNKFHVRGVELKCERARRQNQRRDHQGMGGAWWKIAFLASKANCCDWLITHTRTVCVTCNPHMGWIEGLCCNVTQSEEKPVAMKRTGHIVPPLVTVALSAAWTVSLQFHFHSFRGFFVVAFSPTCTCNLQLSLFFQVLCISFVLVSTLKLSLSYIRCSVNSSVVLEWMTRLSKAVIITPFSDLIHI